MAGLALTIALTMAGCGHDAAGHAERQPAEDSGAAEREVDPPYRVVDLPTPGTIVGRVTASGAELEDSIVTVAAEQSQLCGATRRLTLVERRGDRLEGVVVWLADARSGKPLPVERRYQIMSDDCELEPRVQAAVVGGMLNVRNEDPAEHRVSFLRGGDTVTSVRENDAGQVVPTGKVLAREGLVQARSDTYPWSRAWIRVFDHPYYAVTNRDGTFTIDSVPPGTYRLMAWEARLGKREQQVMVNGKTDSKVEVSF
ncbi:MAG TPA: hypothetical protein VIQ74_15460 [Gemmatimonadaceae bacterium]